MFRRAPAPPPAAPASTRPRSGGGNRKTCGCAQLSLALTVDNLEQSLRHYTDVLGFFLAERYTDKNGVARGAMLKAGAVGIGLSQDDFSKGRDRKKAWA